MMQVLLGRAGARGIPPCKTNAASWRAMIGGYGINRSGFASRRIRHGGFSMGYDPYIITTSARIRRRAGRNSFWDAGPVEKRHCRLQGIGSFVHCRILWLNHRSGGAKGGQRLHGGTHTPPF